LPGSGKFPLAAIGDETQKSFIFLGLVSGPALALTDVDAA
jgi:hypothetical protein